MRGSASGSGSARILICALLLAAGLLLLAGCTAASPSGGAATTPTPAGVPAYAVHVAGSENRGVIILIGRSTCPFCQETKALLANLSVDYYWVDLNTLDQTQIDQVISSVKICSDTSHVPILLINGEKCIIGYQEEQIREAVG